MGQLYFFSFCPHTVFLKANTTTLIRHHKQRNIKEQDGTEVLSPKFIDELTTINKLYEDWLIHQNSSFPVPAPVLVIDGNIDTTPDSLKKLIVDSIPQIILHEPI